MSVDSLENRFVTAAVGAVRDVVAVATNGPLR
jgi:hypothetical protein